MFLDCGICASVGRHACGSGLKRGSGQRRLVDGEALVSCFAWPFPGVQLVQGSILGSGMDSFYRTISPQGQQHTAVSSGGKHSTACPSRSTRGRSLAEQSEREGDSSSGAYFHPLIDAMNASLRCAEKSTRDVNVRGRGTPKMTLHLRTNGSRAQTMPAPKRVLKGKLRVGQGVSRRGVRPRSVACLALLLWQWRANTRLYSRTRVKA